MVRNKIILLLSVLSMSAYAVRPTINSTVRAHDEDANNSIVTPALTVSSGDDIVVLLAVVSASAPTLTVSDGANTFTYVDSVRTSTYFDNRRLIVYHADNVTAGTRAITIGYTGLQYTRVVAACVSNLGSVDAGYNSSKNQDWSELATSTAGTIAADSSIIFLAVTASNANSRSATPPNYLLDSTMEFSTAYAIVNSGTGRQASMVLDAQWEAFGVAFGVSGGATYTVTYNGNSNTGGSAPTDGSSPYSEGATITTLGNTGNLVRTGYTFNNWNTAADGSGTSRAPASTWSMPASNVTLYAQWTRITYTVAYNANGGSGTMTDASSPYDSGATVTVKANEFTRSNYAVDTFNTAANGSGISYAPAATFTIQENTTLYARWRPLIVIDSGTSQEHGTNIYPNDTLRIRGKGFLESTVCSSGTSAISFVFVDTGLIKLKVDTSTWAAIGQDTIIIADQYMAYTFVFTVSETSTDTFYASYVADRHMSISILDPDSAYETGDTARIRFAPVVGYRIEGRTDSLPDTAKIHMTKDTVVSRTVWASLSTFRQVVDYHIAPENIKHWWTGTYAGGQYVDSIGSNEGTPGAGVVAVSTTYQPNAFNMSGASNNGIDCGHVSELDGADQFTILSMIKTDKTGNSMVFSQSLDNNNRIVLYYYQSSGLLYCEINNGSVSSGYFGATAVRFAPNAETMVGIVYNGNGAANADRLKIFCDNNFFTLTFAGTIPATSGNMGTASFKIGAYDEYGCAGILDEVIIIDTILSEFKLQEISLAARNSKRFLIIGQSNAAVTNNSAPATTVYQQGIHMGRTAMGVYQKISSVTASRSWAPKFCNTIWDTLGVPSVLINASQGSTGVVGADSALYWGVRPSNHFDTTSKYGRAAYMARKTTVLKVDGIICFNGELDAANSISSSAFKAGMENILDWFEEDLMVRPPVFMNVTGRSTNETAPDSGFAPIRSAIIELADEPDTDFIVGSNAIAATLIDEWHYDSLSKDTLGYTMARAVIEYNGGSSFSFPRITGNHNKLVVSEPFTPDTTPTGLYGREMSGGTWVVPDTITKSGDTIIPVWTNPVDLVRYMYGKNPTVSGIIKSSVDPYEAAIPYIRYYNFSGNSNTVNRSRLGGFIGSFRDRWKGFR